MTTPHRCKCGDYSALKVCPICRAKKAREDKIVRFLIGDVVRVVKPVIVPVDLGMVWQGET
jgi:hypothetical protein